MLKLITISFMGILPFTAAAQCPESANVTANDFCFYLEWNTPPVPLPDTLVSQGSFYLLSSGTGSIGDPAIYQSGGGGGACSAHQNPFAGTFTLGDHPCDFTSGVLPLTLLSFEVKKISNNQALLTWSSAREKNTRTIEIQKSTNSMHWNTIGSVAAHGDNQDAVLNYSFEDANIGAGINILYRLKIIDWDNFITWSKVVQINGNPSDALQYHVSPAGQLTVWLPENIKEYPMAIYDGQGKKLVTSYNMTPGAINIDLAGYKPGLYLLKLNAPGYISTVKILR